MDAFLRHPDLSATAGHLAVIQRKLDKLNEAKEDSWEQLLTAVHRKYRADELDAVDLVDLLNEMKEWHGPGFSRIWDRVFTGVLAAKAVRHQAHREALLKRDSGLSFWRGSFPLGGEKVPRRDVPVVYLLFDERGEPAYVGSTESFRERMSGHHIRADHPIETWMAWRCRNREDAYLMEERLLAEHKPYLNKKRTR